MLFLSLMGGDDVVRTQGRYPVEFVRHATDTTKKVTTLRPCLDSGQYRYLGLPYCNRRARHLTRANQIAHKAMMSATPVSFLAQPMHTSDDFTRICWKTPSRRHRGFSRRVRMMDASSRKCESKELTLSHARPRRHQPTGKTRAYESGDGTSSSQGSLREQITQPRADPALLDSHQSDP